MNLTLGRTALIFLPLRSIPPSSGLFRTDDKSFFRLAIDLARGKQSLDSCQRTQPPTGKRAGKKVIVNSTKKYLQLKLCERILL